MRKAGLGDTHQAYAATQIRRYQYTWYLCSRSPSKGADVTDTAAKAIISTEGLIVFR